MSNLIQRLRLTCRGGDGCDCTQHEAADRLAAQEALLREAMAALDALMEVTEPPERNCSCHINQPCGWCVEYEMVAIEHKHTRATLAKLRAHLEKP